MKENNHNPEEELRQEEQVPEVEGVSVADDLQEEENEAQEESAESKIEELQAALEKEKKEYLFLMAEFDNFRKRTLKEKSELIRNAGESVMKGLLPIVDDFERGLKATEGEENASAVREGDRKSVV